MSAFSDFTENQIVEHFLRSNNQDTTGRTLYLGLFTSDPGESGYANEATYTGYARQEITFTAIDASGNTSNQGIITFPANLGTTQIIADAAVFDSLTVGTGNQILHGGLTADKTLDLNDVLSFAANALVLNIN
jgi:hypothetical protein|tara:strand:+ start:514 stop:912 length:399 start_codon:yes stop_codon:yes gene_type:complete